MAYKRIISELISPIIPLQGLVREQIWRGLIKRTDRAHEKTFIRRLAAFLGYRSNRDYGHGYSERNWISHEAWLLTVAMVRNTALRLLSFAQLQETGWLGLRHENQQLSWSAKRAERGVPVERQRTPTSTPLAAESRVNNGHRPGRGVRADPID